MSERVVVLGAGFGGLELATTLSERLGEDAHVTVIDKSDAFVFGFSKLDIMFRGATTDAVRMRYRDIAKPGVRVLRETIAAIDPEARTVVTDAGTHEADVLVVALGADYDMDATPGLAEAGNEFYSVAGAERLAGIIPSFSRGNAVIGICGAPFKCPPAPSECALMLDDQLRTRGVRDACEISIVMPLGTPVPPSPETSAALEAEFAAREAPVTSSSARDGSAASTSTSSPVRRKLARSTRLRRSRWRRRSSSVRAAACAGLVGERACLVRERLLEALLAG